MIQCADSDFYSQCHTKHENLLIDLVLYNIFLGSPPLTGTGTVKIIVEDVNDQVKTITNCSYLYLIDKFSFHLF